jgi:glycerol kinase
MAYILSLDQGTTSSRSILFGKDGNIVAHGQREFKQIYPQGGWVEHDPFDILTSQMSSVVEVLGKAGVRARDLAAIGITNQRETTIVWDRETGKPVYNAIVWQDRRTAERCHQMKSDGTEETVRQKTGLLIDPYFSSTKIAWILENVDGARQRADAGKLAFGTVDSWLIWNLTSGKKHITDRTNASRTMLYNIVEGRWDADLLKLFRIPESMMPEVVWSSEKIGPVTTSLGLETGEIAGIAGDQQAALFGQLCIRPGDAKNTYGTGCFLLQNIGAQFVLSEKRLITTLICSLDKKLEYALEGSIFIGGAVVQWLRDSLQLIRSSSDVNALLIGLRRGTKPGHIARAAEESIAFQVADVIEAMDADTKCPFRELRVDGGAAVDGLLMQFQADLLGVPVIRPAVNETTALGAAYLAGLAVGFWNSPDEIRKLRAADTRFEPKAGQKKITEGRARWKRAVQRSRSWHEGDE